MAADATTTAPLLDARYLLEDRIGRGGMSDVYRAADTHLGRTVAIKVVHSDDDAMRGWADRVHNEKATLSTLNHPSLVTLYDAHLEGAGPRYLVMEYVDGPTLAAPHATEALSPRQLADVLTQLADGLTVVHAAGIVHRDVKPSNILLAHDVHSGRWMPKLADFGIACPVGHAPEGSRRVVLGTLMYIAPEQLRGAAPDTPIDVFALGLVMLQCLTGEIEYPVLGDDGRPSADRLTQQPVIPADLDDRWRDLLNRMTRLDPAERPTAAEVARDAAKIARRAASTRTAPVVPIVGEIAHAAASTAPTAVLPPLRRRRRRPAGALLATAAAVSASILIATGAALAPHVSEADPAPENVVETVEPVATEETTQPEPVAPVTEPVVEEPVVEEPVVEEPVVEEPVVDEPAVQPASKPDQPATSNPKSSHANPGKGPSDKANDNARKKR